MAAKPSKRSTKATAPSSQIGIENDPLYKALKDVTPQLTAASPVQLQRAIFMLSSGILRNPSLAYRLDRQLQKKMRCDPDVMAPLMDRQLSVALMDWDIVPADENDAQQVEAAARITEIIRHTPNLHDMMRHLLEAVWYGQSAVNPIYVRDGDSVRIKHWYPIHPDVLTVTEDNELGLRVGGRYQQKNPSEETVVGYESRVRILKDDERLAVVHFVFNRNGADFDDAYETAYPLSGRGLRDIVWYFWVLKQTVLQNWATYAERYAMGIRVGYYSTGNTGGKADMETVLRNLNGDVSAVLPRDPNNPEATKIEILEPSAGRADVYAKLVNDYLAAKIKELIIGQTATTEGTTSGLGANIGDQHAETFKRRIRFDALGLADALTQELVKPLWAMNFGSDMPMGRWEFAIDRKDPKEWLESIGLAVDLGVPVAHRDVTQVLGLSEPEPDEALCQRAAPDPFGLGGGDERDEAKLMLRGVQDEAA